jgi:hypothetical protein
MVLLADRASDRKATMTVASEGFHLGCFTGYSDLIARRRDSYAHKSAFLEEDNLWKRRQEEGSDRDYALPPAMLKPQLRRKTTLPLAVLPENYSVSFKGNLSCALEPISIDMTLSGKSDRDSRTYHLGSIGRVHGEITGEVLGTQTTGDDGTDLVSLESESLLCDVDFGIDQGIEVNLCDKAVIDAAIAILNARAPSDSDVQPMESPEKCLLDRLPSGVSARIATGLISVFIAHEDVNPECESKLSRGLWLQTRVTGEYAYYQHRSQTLPFRHSLNAAHRTSLHLPEDIATQALAKHNKLSAARGRAALVSVTAADLFLKPVYNGQRFNDNGGTHQVQTRPKAPKSRPQDEFVGWEFQKPAAEHELQEGRFANNWSPFDIGDKEQAERALVYVPAASFNWLIEQPTADSVLGHQLNSRVEKVEAACDLSHIYCSLMASLTFMQLAAAISRPKTQRPAKPPLNLSIKLDVPHIQLHLAFPLREQLVITIASASVSRQAQEGVSASADSCLFYVPSTRQTGTWEELGRVEKLLVKAAPPGSPTSFAADAEVLRIRIPFAYAMSKLILNINVTVKTLKGLLQDLNKGEFATVFKPRSEEPKRIPPIALSFRHVSIESKDDPVETGLNLIFRTGLAEQVKRNELDQKFNEKVEILNRHRMAVDLASSDEDQPGRYGSLTAKATTTIEDAYSRLERLKSQTWCRRIRAAKQEQRRREAAIKKRLQDVNKDRHVPVPLAQTTSTPPLFRMALENVRLNVSDLGWSRSEIIDYMSELSTPFKPDTQFSLMVPLKIDWTMDEGVLNLRDYPLPLVRLPPVLAGDRPSWSVSTPFIIAEEFIPGPIGEDTVVYVPCEVLPEGCGAKEASAFVVQVAKTIMPVKTYSRPVINLASEKITEFTWGNSYQPAIQDFMKVIESISHPARDPSPRVGFWDKLRLTTHWKVTVNFNGPAHLHLKGESFGSDRANVQAPPTPTRSPTLARALYFHSREIQRWRSTSPTQSTRQYRCPRISY